MDMPDTDRLGDFAKKKVAESDARVKKMNPKGRKLDKNGNPIVTKEELAKSGMSLREFLNNERGLTPRGNSDTDERVMMGETRKRAAAPITKAEMRDSYKSTMKDIIKDKANKEREEQYGGGLKGGGSVKGYKSGGKVRGAGIAKRGLGKGRMC